MICSFFKARETFLEKNTKAKEDIAQECYDYMLTNAGKQKVLNPTDRTPIADVNWSTTDFEKEIELRVDLYVEKFLKSDGVLKRYECIQLEIKTFCEQVISDLVMMEKEWIESIPNTRSFSPTNVSVSPDALEHTSVSMAALAIGFGLADSQFPFIIGTVWGWFTRKTDDEIDYEYNKHMAKIRRKICNNLDKNWGLVIIKLIDKVTGDVQTFKTMIRQISGEKDTIIANLKQLHINAVKIRNMEEKVIKLTKYLNF